MKIAIVDATETIKLNNWFEEYKELKKDMLSLFKELKLILKKMELMLK